MAPPRSECFQCKQSVIVGASRCPYCDAELAWEGEPAPSWMRRIEIEGEQDAVKRLRAGIASATADWTRPAVIREYESNPKGEAAFAAEAALFDRHGYEPAMQSAEGSHLHAGRLLLTGGLSILAGKSGIRSKGKLTVTFQKKAAATAGGVDVADQITKLAALRDQGILTDAEFQAKKTQLLGT